MQSLLSLNAALPWSAWKPATCLPDDCFCEALANELIRQPANTWSSLAFLLTALWVVWREAVSPTRQRAFMKSELAVFLGSLLVIGLGSAFYHASLTFAGQVIDVSGMYLMATFILFHRVGSRWGLPPALSALCFVLVNGLLMIGQVTTPSLRRTVFGVLLVAAITVEWRSTTRGRRWLAGGAALMTLAFGFWILDRLGIVCDPTSAFQGHALWHVLGAVASGLLYESYRAETLV